MKKASTVIVFVLPFLAGCRGGEPGIAPAQVADFVHDVIAADRATYAQEVVHRLQDVERVLNANEQFRETKTLPLPSQMLRMGAERAGAAGRLRYALISTWAINKVNLPRTDFEKNGLETVQKDPEQSHKGYQTVNGKRWFMALYPDRAVSEACVSCHNTHPESPRKDFELGDVMGAVVVAFPVE